MTGMVRFIFILPFKDILVVLYFEMRIWERKAEGREACEKVPWETHEE